MKDEHDKLFCAVSFALAICRGALTDALQDEPLDKEMIRKILDGTTNDNIAKAVGASTFVVDWSKRLSQTEREMIENDYPRLNTSAKDQSGEPKPPL